LGDEDVRVLTFKGSGVAIASLLLLLQMLYFNLYPNYDVLSEYVVFTQTIDQLKQHADEGFPIIVDRFDTEHKVLEIERKVTKVLSGYQLESHYDNILLISLVFINQHQAYMTAATENFILKKRRIDLETLNSVFRDNRNTTITIKRDGEKPIKLFDTEVFKWIDQLLQTAVSKNEIPHEVAGPLGFNKKPNLEFELTTTSLSSFNKIHTTRFIAELSIKLCQYLDEQTFLKKSSPHKRYDLKQLTLLYELMVILKVLEDKVFVSFATTKKSDYQPHKYMRSILEQYKKKYLSEGKIFK
jgi:hypothetical protein